MEYSNIVYEVGLINDWSSYATSQIMEAYDEHVDTLVEDDNPEQIAEILFDAWEGLFSSEREFAEDFFEATHNMYYYPSEVMDFFDWDKYTDYLFDGKYIMSDRGDVFKLNPGD